MWSIAIHKVRQKNKERKKNPHFTNNKSKQFYANKDKINSELYVYWEKHINSFFETIGNQILFLLILALGYRMA
jgi:hypothetical protein